MASSRKYSYLVAACFAEKTAVIPCACYVTTVLCSIGVTSTYKDVVS